MSSGFFKQHKSGRGVKSLTISSPILASPKLPSSPTSNPSPVVILRVKYKFTAQGGPELHVSPGTHVKFLRRRGSGWIEVQRLDRNEVGLIPAAYSEIAVNDPASPVTEEWLCDMATDVDEPETFSISQVFVSAEKRCWYRLDVTMASGTKLHLAKHYQSFYDLHCALVALCDRQQLPQLPTPLPTATQSSILLRDRNHHDRIHLAELVNRCVELDHYIRSLAQLPSMRRSSAVADFLQDPATKSVTLKAGEPTPANLNEILEKDLILIQDLFYGRKTLFSTTAPLPPVARPATAPSSPLQRDFDNTKYSLYLRQDQRGDSFVGNGFGGHADGVLHKTRTQQRSTAPAMPKSASLQTVTSLSSLISSYDTSDIEDDGAPLRINPGRCILGETKHSSRRGSLRKHRSQSSTDLTDSSGSSFRASFEPRTPVMDQIGFGRQTSIPGPILEHDDFVVQPLVPKMHPEMKLLRPAVVLDKEPNPGSQLRH